METTTETQRRARIMCDDSPMSPREWDNVGSIVGWHNRCALSDDDEKTHLDSDEWLRALAADHVGQDDPDLISNEHVERIIEKYFVLLTIYMYDHSGIALNTGGFSCPWDSGPVGYIYCTKEKALKECGTIESAMRCMEGEIEVYGQYINGSVFGYVLEEGRVCDLGHTHWETVDSCWGFYGYDPKDNGMLDNVDRGWRELLKAADVEWS